MNKDILNRNTFAPKKKLNVFNPSISEPEISSRWSTMLTVSLEALKAPNTTSEFSVLWAEKISNQIAELLFIDHQTLSLIFSQQTLMLPFKWWKWARDQTSPTLILVEWIFKSKKLKKQLSYHSLIQSCTRKLVLIHQEECFFMAHQEPVRLCWLKLLPIKPTPLLLRWLVLNSSRST